MKSKKSLFTIWTVCLLLGVSAFAESSRKEREVKDYKTFLEYNVKHANTGSKNIGGIQADKNEIKFPNKKTIKLLKSADGDRLELGSLSPDKQHIGIFNRKDRSFKVIDSSNIEERKVVLSKFPKGGVFAFSDSRIFAISPGMDGSGGFEMFTSTGGFVKWYDVGDVEGNAVSNTQKYYGVTTNGRDAYLFRLYNMNGNELWNHAIVPGWNALIEFSPDDKYVSVKIPKYWVKAKESDSKETVRKTNKLYLFDIETGKVISEGNYEK